MSRTQTCIVPSGRRAPWRTGARLAVAGCAALLAAGVPSLQAGATRLGTLPPGTALVAEPGAPGGRCVAVRIGEKPGSASVAFDWPGAAPGLYRVALPLRFHARPDFNPALLKLDVAFAAEGEPWLRFPLSLAQLDGTPGAWTLRTLPVLLKAPAARNRLTVSWSFAAPKAGTKEKPAFTPTRPDLDGPPAAGMAPLAGGLDAIGADAPVPVAQLDYPALLVGAPDLAAVTTTLAVERVWPAKVHVFPGEPNPVSVTVRNFGGAEADAVVTLAMQTGLGGSADAGTERVRVPARGTVSVVFPWQAGQREYGHAAVATVSVSGTPVHSNAECFSVSAPIWKTAIQGSGFISWYGRESALAGHVEANRRAYVNVEEAFSWQPSSWSDLNPTNADWWAGQNQFHNSLAGLREWIGLSHSNGIKMITYSWPTISGKSGFDWARRHPDILCREKSGVAPKIDLEDLALYDLVHDRPELWPYRSANWLNNWVNLGLLRAIDHHAREVIRSARTFGWDGLRFDSPPEWSPMGTADVHREFELLGVKDLMKQLLPEYYDSTGKDWSAEAISTRNVRYFRHVFTEALGPDFALSYNTVGLEEAETNRVARNREMSRGGGQLMNEAIRTLGSLSNYMDVAWWTAEKARLAGGYSCVFQAEKCAAPLAAVYSAVFTFASGSHPYLDYGWLGPLPGEYSKFMTRYGEYCWDPAFVPAGADHAGVEVVSKRPVLWERYVRQRQAGDRLQTVVHLIATPEWEAGRSQSEWARAVTVSKPCRAEPEVWLLTAEPEPAAVRLSAERKPGGFSVTVPEVRFWSLVVWSETP